MEGVFIILVFVGVIAITAVLFGVWLVVAIVRLIARILAAPFAPARPRHLRSAASTGHGARCSNDQCHAVNPSSAHFCRRCGQAIQTERVAARRVACWTC